MLEFIKLLPDPIKWFDDMLCVLRYGPGVKLTWQRGLGWPGIAVENLLRRYGVRVYRRQYEDKAADLGCHVPAAQGRWAEYVLRKAGAPLTGPLIHESNRNVKPGGAMPKEWGVPAKPVGLAGRIFDFLMR